MNWDELGPLLAPLAPTLGRLIGSGLPIPFGGTIGQAVGAAIASAMQVDATPDAVANAIKATPPDVVTAQLTDVEREAAAKWSALGSMAAADATFGGAQVAATRDAIVAELASGTWYQRMWRPAAMFVWIGSWPFQLYALLWQITTHDAATISSLSTIIYALCAWNAGPASLAGVYAYGRSQEKIAAANGHA